MPMPQRYRDELMKNRADEHRAALSDTSRDLLKTCAHMVFWVLAGWVFIGFAVHTTQAALGRVLYLTGFLVWVPGVLFSILAAYRRGEKRGDW
ncbi:MAG: hypothetical protein H0W68_05100 [Gemmatimonadaceae bacterium]|nr:hypothetical protein [Gemmatimonadaceae bacterium]